jgi:hypothetical protein
VKEVKEVKWGEDEGSKEKAFKKILPLQGGG